MGEKIRDMKKIKFGNTDFDVELNHGYTSRTKYSIHVQNNAFRFALDDKYFIKLCGLILKANAELDYSKEPANKKSSPK